uniref:Capsid protein n=1 Tax=Conidiobolus taihushanensis totivirus 1 TaxID=3229900 RepID=A0AAU7YSW3_9VIRU
MTTFVSNASGNWTRQTSQNFRLGEMSQATPNLPLGFVQGSPTPRDSTNERKNQLTDQWSDNRSGASSISNREIHALNGNIEGLQYPKRPGSPDADRPINSRSAAKARVRSSRYDPSEMPELNDKGVVFGGSSDSTVRIEGNTPSLPALYGAKMVPTQVAAIAKSVDFNTRLSVDAVPPNFYRREDTKLDYTSYSTAGGAGLTYLMPATVEHKLPDANYWKPVDASDRRLVASYRQEESFSWQINGPVYKDTLPPLEAEYSALDSRIPSSQFRHIAHFMASYRTVDHTNVASRIQQRYLETGVQTSFLRFLVCAWLDYFGMSTIDARPLTAGDPSFGGAGNHGFPSVMPTVHVAAKGTDAENMGGNNSFDSHWNDILTGRHFFLDAEPGLIDAHYVNLSARYAGTFPPERIQIGNGIVPLSYQHRISGAQQLWYHTADQESQLPGAGVRTGYIPPSEILSFIELFVRTTHAVSQCAQAFEIASLMSFQTAAGDALSTYANQPEYWNLPCNHLNFTGNAWLPRDASAAMYFAPFRADVQLQHPIADIIKLRAPDIYYLAATYSTQLGLARSWAFFAASLPVSTLKGGDDERGAANARHRDYLFYKPSRHELALIDVLTKNCCAHMWGYSPTADLLRLFPLNVVDWSSSTVTKVHNSNTVPLFSLVYSIPWRLRMVPDFMVLPYEHGTVKWPKGKEYPLRHELGDTPFVRLASTLAPLDQKLWLADGGQNYSAQYYYAANAFWGEWHSSTVNGKVAENNVNLGSWAKPREFTRPTNPTYRVPDHMHGTPFRNHQLWLRDFITPGSLPTFDALERNNIAHGVNLLPEESRIKARNWHLVLKQVPNVTPMVRCPPMGHYHQEMSSSSEYILWGLVDKNTGRYTGVAMLPVQTADKAYNYQKSDQGAGGSDPGPAAASNDNSIPSTGHVAEFQQALSNPEHHETPDTNLQFTKPKFTQVANSTVPRNARAISPEPIPSYMQNAYDALEHEVLPEQDKKDVHDTYVDRPLRATQRKVHWSVKEHAKQSTPVRRQPEAPVKPHGGSGIMKDTRSPRGDQLREPVGTQQVAKMTRTVVPNDKDSELVQSKMYNVEAIPLSTEGAINDGGDPMPEGAQMYDINTITADFRSGQH